MKTRTIKLANSMAGKKYTNLCKIYRRTRSRLLGRPIDRDRLAHKVGNEPTQTAALTRALSLDAGEWSSGAGIYWIRAQLLQQQQRC
jgi:hypothetical protein